MWDALDVCATYADAAFSRKLLKRYLKSMEWDRVYALRIRRMRDAHGVSFVVALEMRNRVKV